RSRCSGYRDRIKWAACSAQTIQPASGVRAAQGRAEVAIAVSRGWNRLRSSGNKVGVAVLLKVGEEERLVRAVIHFGNLNRPAERTPKVAAAYAIANMLPGIGAGAVLPVGHAAVGKGQ